MWYLMCVDPDFVGGTCVNSTWVFVERFPPALTIEEGLVISGAIIGVWVTAYSLKFFRRFLSK